MFKSRNNLIILIHTCLDIAIVVSSFVIAYFLKKYVVPAGYRGLDIAPNYYIVLLMAVITFYLIFNSFNFYSTFSEKKFSQICLDTIRAVSTGIFIVVLLLYVLKMSDISRILLGLFYVNMIILLLISKGLIFFILRSYSQNVHNMKNILIIGSQQRAMQIIDLILFSKTNMNIVGCLDTDISKIGKEIKNGIYVIGTIENLKNIVLRGVVDEVIFAMPLGKIADVDKYMLLLEEIGIHVRIIPEWQIHSLMFKPRFSKILFDDFLGSPTMIVSPTSSLYRDLFIKSLIDYSAAIFLFILILPLFIFTGALIKYFSRGPVLFKQERLGLNGRKFFLYKFRTMVPDAEKMLEKLKHLNEADGPAFKIDKDPRIIPYIGKFLRKTSIDELPQLLNIIRGEMSLVGPRPPIPSEVEQYDVWQRRRLSMKPGLTCIWQISPNRNIIEFDQWMEMDLDYIDNWSLMLDFQILLKTFIAVFGGHGK